MKSEYDYRKKRTSIEQKHYVIKKTLYRGVEQKKNKKPPKQQNWWIVTEATFNAEVD